MNIFGITIGGSIEQKARTMSDREFFGDGYSDMGFLSSDEFNTLPHETRLQIIASRFGLTVEAYKGWDAASKLAAWQQKQGQSYLGGIVKGTEAAQADARFDRVRGFLAGASTSGVLLLAGVGVAAFLLRRPIMAAMKVGK